MKSPSKTKNEKVLASNRKAFHLYQIDEVFEAGICLLGTEIKSIRQGKITLQESFARIQNEEIFLHNCHITPYTHGNVANHDPMRTRKLLLHHKEILYLMGKVQQKGLALVPLRIYLKRGKAKIAIALGRGKKLYDKRESIKKKEAKREAERVLKGRGR